MIRLTIAVGFLTVFGIVGYALVLLLTNYFEQKNKPSNNKSNQTTI
jgi:hypothetical protein